MLGFSCMDTKRVLSNSILTSRKWARPFHSSLKTVVKINELSISTSCAEYASSWMHLMNCSPVSSSQENVAPFFQPFAVCGFVGKHVSNHFVLIGPPSCVANNSFTTFPCTTKYYVPYNWTELIQTWSHLHANFFGCSWWSII